MCIAIFLKFGSICGAVDQNHNYKLEWPNQLTHTYTIGRSAAVAKVLTIVSPLTYCEFVFDRYLTFSTFLCNCLVL